jgi:hypothetical protein
MDTLLRLLARTLIRMEQHPEKSAPATGPDSLLIVAAYNAARTEIIERIKLREGIIVAFVTASVTIFGAVLAFKSLSGLDAVKLYFVTPALSLIVAVAIRQHNEAIESLAQFLRTNLDPYFRADGNALQWDSYTRAGSVERTKTSWRLRYHLLAVHGPCLASLITGWSHLVLTVRQHAVYPLFQLRFTWAVGIVATLVWIAAVVTTFRSFEARGLGLSALSGLLGLVAVLVAGAGIVLLLAW